MEQRVNKEIYAIGRRDALVHLQIVEYTDGCITVSAEGDKITNAQLREILNREYPRHTFYTYRDDGFIYAWANPI